MKNGGTLQFKDTAGKSCAITPTWPSDAGFIEAKFFQNSSSEFLVRRLTKEGRAFLDAAREGTYR
jgi:hypothetical protein